MSGTSLSSFVPLAKIGEGTFSSVYKVRRVSDQCIYALKKIKLVCLKEKERANALNEVRILASLTNSHLISYKEAFYDQKLSLLCIVMEWADEGDLLNKVNSLKQRHARFPQSQIWRAAYQILSALRLLHRHCILHRDLKSANIFIGGGNYKLGDLNVSKVNGQQQRLAQTQTGTPFYASPQVWQDHPYGSPADIWSFGCVLYEMCCLKPPFQGQDLDQLYHRVQRAHYSPIPNDYSRHLQQLIQSCLQLNPQNRPTAQQLLKQGSTVLSQCEYYEIQTEQQEQSMIGKDQLLATIKMPHDMKKLNAHLPQPNYDGNDDYGHGSTKKIGHLQTKQQQKHIQRVQMISSLPVKKETATPLPERIKNQLNLINRKQESPSSFKSQQKTKIHSSLVEERNQSHRKLEDYLIPIAQQQPVRRKRPLSCNYAPILAVDRKSPYLVNLNRPSNPIASPSYHSDRKGYLGIKQERNLVSERKRIGTDEHDPYFIMRQDKYRCRSANHHASNNSALSQLRQRLEIRYQNMRPPRQEHRDRGEANLRYSPRYELPHSLSSHLLRNPTQSNALSKNQSSYLNQIQHKIQMVSRRPLQSGIRRLVKGAQVSAGHIRRF